MAVIETKYSIGDVVFYASLTTAVKQHPCPDCKGSRKWKAISPSGAEYEFSCPRCSTSYVGNDGLSLRYTAYEPSTTCLTIGSVRTDSYETRGNQYMCRETGVGSGSIYYEADLFPSEAEALEAAKVKAATANVEVEWVAKLYDKTLKLSAYEMSNAALKAAQDTVSEYRDKALDFWASVEWSDTVCQIKEAVQKFREAA